MSQQQFTWPELQDAAYSAPDDEVNQRIHEAAEQYDTPAEDIVENVKFILDSDGSGIATGEGVAISTAANPDNESDSRLEALKLWEKRQHL
jgi:hypothetical protein